MLSKWRHELASISVRHEGKRSIKKSLQIINIKETDGYTQSSAELFLHLYGMHYRFLMVNFKTEHKSLKCDTFISMTLPCHWERSGICANSCITNVLVMGVKLLNPRNISYSKCRIIYKQKLSFEFREFLVISWNSVANFRFWPFTFFFFQEKLFAKVYVNFFCPRNINRNDKFKIGISLPHRDYPHKIEINLL